jgi:hypothetical protein
MLSACATLPPGADPIPASRPGLSDDPVLVQRGSLQAEAGLDVGREAGSWFTAGDLLVRYGLFAAAEARLAIGHYAGGPAPLTGVVLDDLELSLKLRLAEGGVGLWEPALALLPNLALPTGASRLTSGAAEPGALVLATWEWPDLLELTANAGGSFAREDEGRSLEPFLAAAVGRNLSRRLGVEFELVRIGRSETALRHAAVGVGWLLSPDFQLDTWFGAQREAGELTRFAGLGISARWPQRGRRQPPLR